MPTTAALSPLERHALDCLVDASGLVPCAPGVKPSLTLGVSDEDRPAPLAWAADPGAGLGSIGTDSLQIPRPVLAEVADVLRLRSDDESTARDRHGRSPSAENVLVRAGLERQPVVSALARALREQALRLAGDRPMPCLRPWPGGARWAAALTHDLDVVAWWPVFTGMRLVELARRGDLARAGRAAAAALRATRRRRARRPCGRRGPARDVR